MLGGMKRELVPGRWQVAVEGFTGFITDMLDTNIGPKGRKFVPYVFSLFMFILFANFIGMFPVALLGAHPFAVTSQLTITGVLALLSFSIVLIVGFAKHGLHFFSLFVPQRRQGPNGGDHLPDRADQLPDAAVQPRPATVRRDHRRSHPDGSARRLRHQRPQLPTPCGWRRWSACPASS